MNVSQLTNYLKYSTLEETCGLRADLRQTRDGGRFAPIEETRRALDDLVKSGWENRGQERVKK